MKVNLEKFSESGYEVIDIAPLMPHLKNLRAELFELFNTMAKEVGLGPIKSDEDLIAFRRANQQVQYAGVKHGCNAFSLYALAGDPHLGKLLREELNFKCPNHDILPNLRVDMPIEDQSIFRQHQDYIYNKGSQNAVTLWIPLQDTNIEEGALLVCPGSHKDGVYPSENGVIPTTHEFDLEPCPIAYGQGLLFDQKLVHQSGFNRSDKIRISVQLRMSDLACADYAARDYKLNYETRVFL